MITKFTQAIMIGLATLIAIFMSSYAASHELGLQLYSLRNQFSEDPSKTFQQISHWDIHSVEGGGDLYGMSLNEFKVELDKHQISVVSADTNYEELRDNPMAAVYKAKFFGARFATFYWIPHEQPFTIDDAKAAVDVINKAGKLLEQNGITLQYHAHGYEFLPYENGTIFDYMIENVTDAKFQMDVFWVRQAGLNPTKLLQKYPGSFTSLHLKDRLPGTPDSSTGGADVETNVILGQGDVGIASVVAEAERQGIRYFFLEDESSRVLLQIPESIKFLKSLD